MVLNQAQNSRTPDTQAPVGGGLNANQIDFSDSLTEILLNGLLSGATSERRALLSNAQLTTQTQSFRRTLITVVDYNLNAIQNIAQTTAKCAVQPSQNSRRAIETARDSAFDCLQGIRSNPQGTNDFDICLQEVLAVARRNIDALKPAIDACLATIGTTPAPNATRVI